MVVLRMEEVELCNATEIYGSGVFPSCPDYTVFDHYVNACLPAALIQFDDQDMEPKMKILYGTLFPILAVLVLLTNGVVIAVLSIHNTKRATIEPLLWMAICSLLMAVSPLPFTVYYYNLNHLYDPIQSEALCYLHKICMEVMPFFFNTLITFFTLLLGAQRFIAVHYPLQSFRWCTRRMVRRHAQLIVCLSLFLTSTHFLADTRVIFHFCIAGNYSVWVARCFVGHSPLSMTVGVETFAWIFDTFRICLLLVPSGILFILTILLIRTIRVADTATLTDQGARHRHSNRAATNTTLMLTVIIVLFLVARLPTTLLILLVKISAVFPSTSKFLSFTHDHYLVAFNNLMFITIHPITFALYMLMSRRFRVTLRRLLGWKRFATDEEFNAYSSTRVPSFYVPSRNLNEKREMTFPLVNRESSFVLQEYHGRTGSGRSVTFRKDEARGTSRLVTSLNSVTSVHDEKEPVKEVEKKTVKTKFALFTRIFMLFK